ncbi:MAG: 4Fe-4S binding protein [Chloroflexi bacterium]|nr:4Fe-4S binding protein [Chloroflexota bacterium]
MPTEFTDQQLQRMIEVRKRRPPKNLAVIDQSGCTGCEVCVVFCPADCIYFVSGDENAGVGPVVEVAYDLCIGCTLCAQYCPWDTIFMIPYEEALSVAAPQLTLKKASDNLLTAAPAGRATLEAEAAKAAAAKPTRPAKTPAGAG